MGYITQFQGKVLGLDGKTDQAARFETLVQNAQKYDQLEDQSIYKEEYLNNLKVANEAIRSIKNPDALSNFMQVLHNNADEWKWYDHEDHMKQVSRAFPEFIFQLAGEGEEHEDTWVKWFSRGRIQGGRAVMTLPTLDLSGWKVNLDK
jgi:hypothetical protein